MATVRFLFGFLCLIGFFGNRLPNRHLLINPANRIISIAQSQIGVQESLVNNHGKAVAAYLKYTNLKEGKPWCAAFVCWVYGKAGYATPKTAWSPALFPATQRVTIPKMGDVFGIYFSAMRRIAHCGLVEYTKDNWVITIEGNTNIGGSRNGDGVYRRWRHRKTIYAYARWLPDHKGVANE